MNTDFFKDKLKLVVSQKRYDHSLRVLETALILGKIYNVDLDKLAVASLLHDYAKEMSKKELIEISKEHFKTESNDYLDNTEILHSYASAHIAKNIFGIHDVETLNAIKYHTTGRKNMDLIEKIVYIADAIEPKRDYPYVEKIRDLALVNLDKAILLEVTKKIEYLLNQNYVIHTDSIEMRNWLLKIS
ncbi:MAG: bis(5'-nucleosyl)-tetraphosphatase (symmetrical) YqeK [Cetobacterium sp.]